MVDRATSLVVNANRAIGEVTLNRFMTHKARNPGASV